MKLARLAVNIAINQYLNPPNITQKFDPSIRYSNTASVLKREEVKHAKPLPQPQDRPPDTQKKSMLKSSEQTNNSGNLSPQYLFPPNSITFESKNKGTAHTIFPPPSQDQPPDTRIFQAQKGGVTPRVVTQWSIISRFYFLRFSQRPPFIFSVV